MSGPILSVSGLSVRYETRRGMVDAVRRVSFDVPAKACVGLVGESGSGKTTIALALMGMLMPPGRITEGNAIVAGIDLATLTPEAHARLRLRTVAYVPQGAMNSLNPVIRIKRSISHILRDHGERLDAGSLDHRIAELLESVGLSPKVAERYPHELSGGMKQRVCIAIATALKPRLIIADEPTSALDVVTQRQIMATLHEAQQRLGSGMILIGHDMGLMAQTADRLIVMRQGQIVEDETKLQVFLRPTHAYTRELIDSVPTLETGRASNGSPDAAPSDAVQTPLIELDGVSKTYPSTTSDAAPVMALQKLNLRLTEGNPRLLAVVGQSGSGKTTLGSLLLGFETPTEGTIRYRGTLLTEMTTTQRRMFRREVQAVFQDPYSTFNPFYRVEHSLSLPLRNFGLASGRDEMRSHMESACQQVGLDPGQVLDRFAHQLSGGQRQRLMVARALMLRPSLLIADEPVSMVDASLRASILDALQTLRNEHHINIIYITHDLATAYRVSDAIAVLHKGQLVEVAGPDAVMRTPNHPYTQMLVNAIPWPDPARPWGAPDDESRLAAMTASADARRPVAFTDAGMSVGSAA
jgi:peptide/nickel transport system ATP-binding protein